MRYPQGPKVWLVDGCVIRDGQTSVCDVPAKCNMVLMISNYINLLKFTHHTLAWQSNAQLRSDKTFRDDKSMARHSK